MTNINPNRPLHATKSNAILRNLHKIVNVQTVTHWHLYGFPTSKTTIISLFGKPIYQREKRLVHNNS